MCHTRSKMCLYRGSPQKKTRIPSKVSVPWDNGSMHHEVVVPHLHAAINEGWRGFVRSGKRYVTTGGNPRFPPGKHFLSDAAWYEGDTCHGETVSGCNSYLTEYR